MTYGFVLRCSFPCKGKQLRLTYASAVANYDWWGTRPNFRAAQGRYRGQGNVNLIPHLLVCRSHGRRAKEWLSVCSPGKCRSATGQRNDNLDRKEQQLWQSLNSKAITKPL